MKEQIEAPEGYVYEVVNPTTVKLVKKPEPNNIDLFIDFLKYEFDNMTVSKKSYSILLTCKDSNEDYLMSSGGAVRILCKMLARVNGFFWLHRNDNDEVEVEIKDFEGINELPTEEFKELLNKW